MSGAGGAQKPKRFFYSLDGIRAIASIVVVLFHTSLFFGVSAFQESYLAVDLFFGLSGVVICHTYEKRLLSGLSVPHFAWIRAARIYPLYILGTMVSIFTLWAFEDELAARHLPMYSLLALVLMPNLGMASPIFFPLNVPAWSLFLEFTVNVVYARILRFLNVRTLTVIVTAAALGLLVCTHLVRPHSLSVGWRNMPWRGMQLGLIGGFFRVGFSFFAGIFVYRKLAHRAPRGLHGPWANWIPGLIFVTVAALLSASPSSAVRPIYDFLAVTVAFPAIIYLALWFQPRGLGARLCKFGGAVSYAVYAIHYPLSVLLQDVMLRVTGVGLERYAPWSGFAFLVLLVTLCWIIDQIYDTPLRRRLLALWRPATVAGIPERA